MTSMAPQCAGGPDADHRCTRKLDDPGQDRRWLVLLGIYGQPSYFFCPECEQTDAEWIERQLGEEGERAGCTGIVRLETGSPAEVYGRIRDMLVQAEVV